MDKTDSHQLTRSSQSTELVRQTQHTGQSPEIEEIRLQIEGARRQIAQNLREIQVEMESTVEQALDWRRWVRQYPLPAVGVAAAFGFYLGIR